MTGQYHDLINCPYLLESRQAGRDLHLDVNRAGFDALERHGGDTLDHSPAPDYPSE